MKVNIIGRCALPGYGILPVRGIELNDMEILRLLNFKKIKVYDALTKELITKQYLMNKAAVEAKKKPAVVVETPAPVVEVAAAVTTPEPVVVKEEYVEPEVIIVKEETPIIETVDEEPAETIEEIPVVEEAEEVVDEYEAAPIEETIQEEEVVVKEQQEKPRYNGKKNKKNRHQ